VITCRVYRDGHLEQREIDTTQISELLTEEGVRVWLDLAEPTDEELELIAEEFSLHPLSIEDSKHWRQRPKVEVFPNYFFVVVHGLMLAEDDELVDGEIHAFAGHRFLVTIRARPAFDLVPTLSRWDEQPELTAEGGGFLLYALLDVVVDGYLTIVERFEDLADDLEDRVFADEPDPELQQDVFSLKRRVVKLRRLVMPLREVLDLVQEQPGFVTRELAPYYRDVADHVIRAIEFVDNIREILTASLEAQLSQMSNRLNAVMKKLTSWAAILLVPTLIAGVYGMNFDRIPELHWALGYPFALGLMVVAAGALYIAFKKRDWL